MQQVQRVQRVQAMALSVFLVLMSALAHAQSPAGRQLSFAEALTIALAKSPVVLNSADRVELAMIQERLTRAQLDLKVAPTMTTGTDPLSGSQRTFGLTVSQRLTSGAQIAVTATSARYFGDNARWSSGVINAGITQPLLGGLGPAATADIDNARRAGVTATRAHVDVRQQLVLSVAQTYFAATRSNRLAQAASLALIRAERLKTASAARAQVGLATQLDVLRADLLVSQAQAVLATQREAHATAIDRLKRLIGVPLSADIEIADERALDDLLAKVEPSRLADGSPAAIEGLVRYATQQRLELTEASDRVEDARRQARVTRWNLLPRVDLTANYTKQAFGGRVGSPFDNLFGGWRVGITTSYPLDRAAHMAAIDTNSVTVQSAERAIQQANEDVSAEVRSAHRAWIRSGEVTAIQQKALELAQRQLRLAQLRYERGLDGNFDVIDAEANVYQAESALVDAQIERVLTALALQRATGALRPEDLAR